MKNIFLVLIIGLALVFQSCEKDTSTEDMSRITYYVTFGFDDTSDKDQLGNDMVIIEKGTSYDVNDNYTAFEGTDDVKSKTVIEGSVDSNTPGYYAVTYSAVNNDGYAAGKTKGVFVSDPDVDTDISGNYSATVYRTPTGNEYTEGYDATVTKVADGIFYIDRMLGSYYYDGFGYSQYGSYFVHGFVSLSADNTLDARPEGTYSPGWSDSLSGFENGAFDPETGVLTFTSIYAGGRGFHVTLTPKGE